uniref:Uncharacterized protein n=1 Tax=Hyaloperonospora arabidopsidis (strain Emoy2) TaxID=559515 RepID=M4BKQ3_HYAAE
MHLYLASRLPGTSSRTPGDPQGLCSSNSMHANSMAPWIADDILRCSRIAIALSCRMQAVQKLLGHGTCDVRLCGLINRVVQICPQLGLKQRC